MEGVYLAAFLSVQLALITAVVQTPSGPLQGIDGELVTKFFGVPYANKPERLEKATLVTPWTGRCRRIVSHLNHGYCQSCSVDVRNAIEKGPWCYQISSQDPPPGVQESEDCLTLDIYTPVKLGGVVASPTEGKAVMVFIHGGGFLEGASSYYAGASTLSQFSQL